MFFSELGKKLSTGYEIGKKFLGKAVQLGHKVSSVVKSAPVQAIYSMLPPSIQTPLAVAGAIGQKALEGLENLQSKINTGEVMANRVKSSFQEAKRSVELARQPKPMTPAMAEQGSSIRIPQVMTTGGRRNQTMMDSNPMDNPIMTF
jgi:hypothetical protein